MTAKADDGRALGGVRVLDLSDEKGMYCTKLLAEMGADVLRIEPPAGDARRQIGPFVHDVTHPERSLFFLHYNSSKRGITLDIEKPEGRRLLERLIESADVLVETFPPGYLEGLGLDYERLSKLNPRLIMASITPFGQTGPYRDYKSCDLVACAMGGQMYVSGDVDTSPIRGYGNQSYHTASNFAAIAILMATYERNFSGEGQNIDISLEEAVAAVIEHVNPYYWFDNAVPKRQGTLHWNDGFRVFESKDGHVLMPIRPRWQDLAAWMDSEGMADDLTGEQYSTPAGLSANIDHVVEVVAAFAKTHTADELVEYGQLLRLPFSKVRRIEEVVEDGHLMGRGFWVEVDYPEFGGSYKHPGPPYKADGSPWRFKGRAPRIGEHNIEVYKGELGLTEEEITVLREGGVI